MQEICKKNKKKNYHKQTGKNYEQICIIEKSAQFVCENLKTKHKFT